MKKTIILVILILVGLDYATFAQQPIAAFNEDGHSLEWIKSWYAEKNITPRERAIRDQWGRELVASVNEALRLAGAVNLNGEPFQINERNIFWILNNCRFERRRYKDFKNSRIVNGKIEFFIDHREFDGLVAVFEYNTCQVPLFKKSCINLIIVDIENPENYIPVPVVEKQPENPKSENDNNTTINININCQNCNHQTDYTPCQPTGYWDYYPSVNRTYYNRAGHSKPVKNYNNPSHIYNYGGGGNPGGAPNNRPGGNPGGAPNNRPGGNPGGAPNNHGGGTPGGSPGNHGGGSGGPGGAGVHRG